MVCDRCISAIKEVFIRYDLSPKRVKLGEVQLSELSSDGYIQFIKGALKEKGFQWIECDAPILVIKIKSAIIDLFGKEKIPEDFKLLTYVREKFTCDYSHKSRVFSHYQKGTIEHYLIRLRIEKAKELQSYKEHNVGEVAYRLGYTSTAHFFRQFKAKVGVSPMIAALAMSFSSVSVIGNALRLKTIKL